jgi:hypothetical protein
MDPESEKATPGPVPSEAPPRLPALTGEALTKVLTGGGSRLGGPVYTVSVLAAQFLGLAAFCCYLAASLPGFGACILGMAFALIVARQADLIGLHRAALYNSHLGGQWLGALCEALYSPGRRVRSIAALLLTQLLPRLKEEDWSLLTADQHNALYRRLRPLPARLNPDLTIAILNALPVMGTEGALLHVERLATRHVATHDGWRIRHAARGILSDLQQRLAAERQVEIATKLSGARDRAERADAEQVGAAMSAHVDAQIQAIEADLLKSRAPGMRLGFLIATWVVIIPYTVVNAIEQFSVRHWAAGAILALAALLETQLYRLTLRDEHRLLASRLARIDDVRCIGRLVELLSWPGEAVSGIAAAALTRLLPRVRATDGALLTEAQRTILYERLTLANARRNPQLLISILRALEQIGDAPAVAHVTHLANARVTTADERRVWQAATSCLPFLRERAKLTQVSHSLLRASAATPPGAETLVRPAAAADASDAAQLLRAGQAQRQSPKQL